MRHGTEEAEEAGQEPHEASPPSADRPGSVERDAAECEESPDKRDGEHEIQFPELVETDVAAPLRPPRLKETLRPTRQTPERSGTEEAGEVGQEQLEASPPSAQTMGVPKRCCRKR